MIWFGLIVFAIFLILFFTTIKVKIEYNRRKENDHIHFEISIWWNLLKLQFDVPMLQLQSIVRGVQVKQKTEVEAAETPLPKKRFRFTLKNVQGILRRLYKMRIRVHDLNKISKKMFKHIRCEQLEWYTKVGVGDAATTGIFTGVVWGVKSTLVGFISHYVTLRTVPRMNVVPVFQGQDINTQFHCILRFRIGNVIIAGTRILFKFRKGREGLWQNTLFRA